MPILNVKVWSDCKQNVKKKVRNIDTDQFVRLNERELRLCNLLQLDTNSSEGHNTTNVSNESEQWIKQENFDEELYDEQNLSTEHLAEDFCETISSDVVNNDNDDFDQNDEDTAMEEMDRISDSDENLSVEHNNGDSMTNTQTEDEIFSIYIESELEKVKDKALFVSLKQKITNLVYDAQIKMMEQTKTTKTVQKNK